MQPVQAVPITNETLVETKKLWDAVAELSKNLTHINQTLTTNITWVKEDFDKDHVSLLQKLLRTFFYFNNTFFNKIFVFTENCGIPSGHGAKRKCTNSDPATRVY